jgi:hypothetical protein
MERLTFTEREQFKAAREDYKRMEREKRMPRPRSFAKDVVSIVLIALTLLAAFWVFMLAQKVMFLGEWDLRQEPKQAVSVDYRPEAEASHEFL